jgi:antitoxin VapB
MDVAKLFKNGRSQAVRLPKKYRFDDSEVFVNKIGDSVILIPKDSKWDTLEKSLNNFSDDFLTERNQPEIQKRDGRNRAFRNDYYKR